ncbi:hypothetical protein ACCS88_36850, partial [Rhizobium ruizarguesonis]
PRAWCPKGASVFHPPPQQALQRQERIKGSYKGARRADEGAGEAGLKKASGFGCAGIVSTVDGALRHGIAE